MEHLDARNGRHPRTPCRLIRLTSWYTQGILRVNNTTYDRPFYDIRRDSQGLS